MHPASAFAEHDQDTLRAFVAARGFAVLAAQGERGPVTAHAAVLIAGELLRFHLSAANRMVPALAANPRLVAVVTGPDAYVSPDWYAAADQVPTWNYVAAEIEGDARPLGRDGAATLLDDLSAHFEAALAPKPPWTRAKMSPGRFETLTRAIIGARLIVDRLEGTFKLSQNKTEVDRAGVIAALGDHPVAGLMKSSDVRA